MLPNATARDLLKLRRAADRAFETANRESVKDEPWSLGNVRVWQGVACRMLDRYNDGIRAYLERRRARRCS